jgi:type IV pilus assembly protein PilM
MSEEAQSAESGSAPGEANEGCARLGRARLGKDMQFAWWRRKSRVLAGVDIGSSSVKVVELRKKGRSLQLVSVGVSELEPGVIADGEIRNAPAVSAAVARLLEQSKVSARDMAASVAGNAVMVKRIAVPAAVGEALDESILAESERQLSWDVDELNIDYQVLGPAADPQAVEVMLVAARREKIAKIAGVLAEAGRNPALVDLDAFAVQTAFETAYPPEAGQTVALLNVGARLINVNIVREGAPLFTRDIPAGGAQYTAALQKALNLSFQAAEAVKTGKDGVAAAGPNAGSIDAVRSAFLDSLANEVQRTLSFYGQTGGPGGVDAVYLSGGTARLPGLRERLHRELDIPVEILDPLRGIRLPASGLDSGRLAGLSPQLAVAVGLALRSFDVP